MSIILLNDLVFTYTEEGHIINKEICLYFFVLNFVNFLCCSLYLYIYYKIPFYQNNSNSLTRILTQANLISGFSNSLFYSDLYFRKPITLTIPMKIATMLNPLVIFTFYFWCACLTHNIYVTFYNYAKSLDKRIKLYKYQLLVYLFIFYICTMFCIRFKEKKLKSKYFSFIENYRVNYIIFFYLLGLFIITYIISRLYYIIKKKSQSFSLTAPNERLLIIKNLFQSLVFRHILFILYFLFTFVPVNLMMMIKYMFRIVNFEHFYLNFITMTLISLYGTFIFAVKLSEPIIRDFLLSSILCNKSYIKEYEPLLKNDKLNITTEEDITESLNEEKEKDILINVYRDLDKSFMSFYENNRLEYEKFEQRKNFTSFNLGQNNGLRFMHGDKKDIIKYSKDKNKNFSMKDINKIKEQKLLQFNKNNLIFKEPILKFSSNIIGPYNDEEKEDEIELNNIDNINNINNKNKDINDTNNTNNINNTNNNIDIINQKKSTNKLSRLNTLKDSIHEQNEERSTLDKIYSKLKSAEIGVNINNKRSNKNVNEKQLKLRNSNKSKNSEISEISQKEENNEQKNCITVNLNKDLLKKKKTIQIARKNKNLLSQTKKMSTDIIYEGRNLNIIQPKRTKIYSKNYKHFFEEEISGYDLLNYHLEVNDNVQRLIAISICINDDRIYDNQEKYQQYYYSPLPWKNTNFYKEKTPYIKYNEKNFPNFLNLKGDSRFNGMEFQVLAYSPFVFHHLRMIDGLSIDDILKSLDIKKNLEIIKESRVTGGRGNNTIFRTWDKKLIIKTIDDEEKNILINKMLEEYHERIKEAKTILSHIYGVYKIELGDKGESNVMVQRNMNDLFLDSNILTFDLKGSTVDRQSIKKEDINLNKKALFNKYKNTILKDIDLKIIDIKIELNHFDGSNILNSICNDSIFLQKYDITDYSLLIFVNKFNKKNLEKHLGNCRIIPAVDEKYIFNFSIIDYLGTFNLEKKGEKLMKDFVGVFRASKDTNFSVQNPQNYGTRFRKFAKNNIIYEKEENENDNFSS